MMPLPDHVSLLDRELRAIFSNRLQSLVAYGLQTATPPHGPSHGAPAAPPTTTMAIVESLDASDLTACAKRAGAWHDAGLATPLLVVAREFSRSLDAFPLEFSAMIDDYAVASGTDPFVGVAIDPADIRRACEVQARSHLLHLREGLLEAAGNGDALAVLIVRSAAPFAALLTSVARLQGLSSRDQAAAGRQTERELQLPPGAVTDVVALAGVAEVSSAEAARIFPPYLDAAVRLVQYVDGWSGT